MKLRVAKCTPMFCTTGSSRLQSPCVYRGKLYFVYRRSIGPKPTCDKPKARRPKAFDRERSEQHSPKVYSSRSEHLPEAPTCIRPRVHWPEVYSSIREVNWVYVKSRKVEENSRKSPERVQKKSRKNPEKVQKKSRKSPEKDQNHPRVCFRKV